jgi:hypothetical protein
MLLREVLARNPFKNRAAWKEIATELSTLNFQVEPRRVKEIYVRIFVKRATGHLSFEAFQ